MKWLAQENFHQNLIQFYIERLASLEGVVIIVLGLLAAALVLGIEKSKWLVIPLCMYAGCFSYLRVSGELPPLPGVFQTFSSLSQPLTFGSLALLTIAVLRPVPWTRQRLVNSIAVAILAVQLVVSLRQIAGGLPERGITGLLMYSGVFLLFSVGVSRWLHDEHQVRAMARAVSFFIVLFLLSSFVVLIVDREAAFVQSRLAGISDNSNRAAALLALTIPFALMLAFDTAIPAPSRLFHLGVAAVGAGFLVFTGSRAGALSLIIGITVFFRKRLGAYVLAAILLVCVFLAALAFTEKDLSAARTNLFRFSDTRTDAWLRAMENFYASPLIGIPTEIVAVESSYVSAAVQGGIAALIPFAILLILMARSARKLITIADPGRYRSAIDLVLAGYAQLLVMWTFEGYMFGLVTNTVFVTQIILVMGAAVLEKTAAPFVPNEVDEDFEGPAGWNAHSGEAAA